MAINRYVANAVLQSMVDTYTPATISMGSTFTLTRNGKSVTYTATATTAASVTAGMLAALQAVSIPEFDEVTFADLIGTLTATANTPGEPFVFTTSAGGTGSPTFTVSHTILNSGPNDVNLAANWSNGIPVNGDNGIFDVPGTNAYFNLGALAAIAFATLEFRPSWNGQIGLPDWNPSGYYEDKDKYFKNEAAIVNVNCQSGRIKLDQQNIQVAANIYALSSPADFGYPALMIKNNGAASTILVMQGSVGLATLPNDLGGTWATITIGDQSQPATDVDLTIGQPGVSAGAVTTINQNGGKVTYYSTGQVTTWTMSQTGTATYISSIVATSTGITTLNLQGNVTFNWQSTLTIVTANVGPKATLDGSQLPLARTITNTNLSAGSTINDPNGKIAFTNPFAFAVGCGFEDVTLVLGKNRHGQVS